MTKFFGIIAVALITTMGVHAQRDYDISQDFFTYRAEKLAYFDSLKAARNGNLKGTGYKPFRPKSK